MIKGILRGLKKNWLVFLILGFGVIFKILVTMNGNFIFHIDTARDFVDVRNMVELGNIRLTGQTSAIEGVFNGPGWYYSLAIPYILSDGSPYSGILFMIFLWAVGGYFLYKLTFKWGFLAWFTALIIWFGSPYVSLTTVYSFNPNPTLLIYPLFIYLVHRYLRDTKLLYGLFTALLAGYFYQIEMYPSLFLPFVVIFSIIATKKTALFRKKEFWIPVGVYLLFFVPQILFDLRHDYIMSNSLMAFLRTEMSKGGGDISLRTFIDTWNSLAGGLSATFLNSKILYLVYIWLFVGTLGASLWNKYVIRKIKELDYFDNLSTVVFLSILIPFVGFSVIPAGMNSWHIGPIVASSIVLFSYSIFKLTKNFVLGKPFVLLVLFFVLYFVSQSTLRGFSEIGKVSGDPSNFANELRAIDYAYSKAQGKNFKAYVYLPSIIDYPYQYLFWWYGLKKYGYTPLDYAYLPDVPEYIADREKFIKPKEGAEDSGLVILIEEPDRIGFRAGWEGELIEYKKVVERKEIGPLIVETRME